MSLLPCDCCRHSCSSAAFPHSRVWRRPRLRRMEDIIMYRDDVGACFGLSKWSWFNPPKLWEPEGDGLVVEAASDSDFWVTTYYGFVRDTGHALLRRVPADFSMSTTFRGDCREQYDRQVSCCVWMGRTGSRRGSNTSTAANISARS